MAASDLQDALDKLVGKAPGWTPLDVRPRVGARPGGVGTGAAGDASGGASGFAEDDFTKREHYAERTVISSDGFFSFSYKPIKSILLATGSRATFKEPV